MSESVAKNEVLLVSVEQVESVMKEVQALIEADRYAILESLLSSYVKMMSLLSDKTTTVARLRHLCHIETSERLESVSPEGESAGSGPDAGAGQAAEGSDPQPDTPETDSETAPSDEPPSEPTANEAGESTGKDETASTGDAAEGADPVRLEEADASSEASDKENKPKGHGRIPAAEYAADNTHVGHPELEVGQCCPGCGRGSLYELRTTAPWLQIVGQPPLVAKSWTASTLRCSTCGETYTPELPKEANKGGPRFAKSAAAMKAYLHYFGGMPFERLETLQSDAKVPVPASIQWKLVEEGATDLEPLRLPLLDALARASLLHFDDSPMKVLELMGKRRARAVELGLIDAKRTGIQTTAFLGLDANAPPVALFFTGPKHAGENLAVVLERRPEGLDKPMVMSDALNRNVPETLRSLVVELNCLTHGRRGVFQQLECFPVEARSVLVEFAKVFAIDKRTRQEKMTDQQRLRVHQLESGPILGHLRKEIRTMLYRKRTVEPNSDLGKAFKYILKHWVKLTRFLRIPGAPLTNNIAERLLKTAIRYRKNSGFYKTLHGAEVGDLYMSLMQTARLNGVDPLEYLTALLENADEVAADPSSWLPWCYEEALAEVEAREAMGEAIAA